MTQLGSSTTTSATGTTIVGAGGGGSSSQAYGEAWYWDKRYSQGGEGGEREDAAAFDWYQKYPSLSPLLRLYIPHLHHRVLIVGCGNSAFSEGMVDDGYSDVVNIDISSVVIKAMQKKYSDRPQLKYMKMDVRDMSAFDSSSFDAVVDKGTLDSLLCGHNSRQNAGKMLGEIWRVLKDKGVYILITYGSPAYRLRLLRDSCSWSIKLHMIEKLPSRDRSDDHHTLDLTTPVPLDENGCSSDSVIGKADVHYIYVCTKDNSEK